MSKQKMSVVEVTTKKLYMFPTGLNGWTDAEVIEDWFKKHSLYSSHATRDHHLLGGSEEVLKTEILDKKSLAELNLLQAK